MNKRLTVLLALALVFALLLAACGKERPTAEPQATDAQGQTVAPTVQPLEVSLTAAVMTYNTWSSPNGLTVNLSATPSQHENDHSAEFVIRVGDVEELRVPCEWDGSAYTASADLNAKNGYGYYLVIRNESGASQELTVNSPDVMNEPLLVNMAEALDSYCILNVESASITDGVLTVDNGNVTVQTPAITVAGETVTCTDAALVLTLDDQEISRISLTLIPTEVDGSFEQTLRGTPFEVGELADGQELKLRLEATLSDGQILTAVGTTWLCSGGELQGSVG